MSKQKQRHHSFIPGNSSAREPMPNPNSSPNKLTTFLLGTLDPHSPVRRLRGQGDILRIIWIYACSEWWQLHLQDYMIPLLGREISESNSSIADLRSEQLFDRKKLFDCPLAIVNERVEFPALGTMPQLFSHNEVENAIAVNMMPFDLFDPIGTIPEFLYGYLPMIEQCRNYVKSYIDYQYAIGQKTHCLGYQEKPRQRLDHNDLKNRIAYLTVDERPILEAGQSHRRGGVHVECPGALRQKEIADKSKYTTDLSWYHPWGMGRAIDEYLVGGIFLASNLSDSTAVWNCRVHDTFGDIIGPHGSLERCRDVIGPPSKLLEAGELIWLSNRTPHESLPLKDRTVRRQFFRLVVGEIAFWFADHNTPNPTGFSVPSFVPIIEGNKFEMVNKIIPIVWEPGTAEEIRVAREEANFRKLLYDHGVGFLADDLLRIGIYDVATLSQKKQEVNKLIKSLDPHYYSTYTLRFIDVALSRIQYGY